jgi:TonB family protein
MWVSLELVGIVSKLARCRRNGSLDLLTAIIRPSSGSRGGFRLIVFLIRPSRSFRMAQRDRQTSTISEAGRVSPRPHRFVLAACLSVLWLAAGSMADDRSTVEKELNRTYDKSIVVLRGFPSGKTLVYDNDGNLIRGGSEGPWTIDGNVQISKIRLTSSQLRIKGYRVFLAYDPKEKSFQKLRADQVDLNVNLTDPAEIPRLLHNIFLGRGENLADVVPAYWQPFLRHEPIPAPDTFKKPGVPSQGPGERTTAPVAVYMPDPPYTEEARVAKYSGIVILQIVVDENGFVRDVIIIRPAGLGLDEQAIKTVRTWKFRPAERNGQPVKSRLAVEVSFRIA